MNILGFSIIVFFLVASPGPNGALILKTAVSHNRLAGITNIIGIITGTFIYGCLTIFGLSTIIINNKILFISIKIAGAFYLLYMGIKTIYGAYKERKSLKKEKNPFDMTENIEKADKQSFLSFYLEGFFTQILNPKVAIFYLSIFPQFIHFGDKNILNYFLLVFIHASFIFIWFSSLVMLIRGSYKLKGGKNLTDIIILFSGVILISFASYIIKDIILSF